MAWHASPAGVEDPGWGYGGCRRLPPSAHSACSVSSSAKRIRSSGATTPTAMQEHRRQRLDLVAEGREEVIMILVIVAEFAGAEPTRHGAPPGGEQGAGQQGEQAPGEPGVEK